MSLSKFPLLDLPLVPLKNVLSKVSPYGQYLLYLQNSQLNAIREFKQDSEIDLVINFNPDPMMMEHFEVTAQAFKIGPLCISVQSKFNGNVFKIVILCAEVFKSRCSAAESLLSKVLTVTTDVFPVKLCLITLRPTMDYLQKSLPAINAKETALKMVNVKSDFFKEYVEKHKTTLEFHARRFRGHFYHYEKHYAQIFTCPEITDNHKPLWKRIHQLFSRDQLSSLVILGFSETFEKEPTRWGNAERGCSWAKISAFGSDNQDLVDKVEMMGLRNAFREFWGDSLRSESWSQKSYRKNRTDYVRIEYGKIGRFSEVYLSETKNEQTNYYACNVREDPHRFPYRTAILTAVLIGVTYAVITYYLVSS